MTLTQALVLYLITFPIAFGIGRICYNLAVYYRGLFKDEGIIVGLFILILSPLGYLLASAVMALNWIHNMFDKLQIFQGPHSNKSRTYISGPVDRNEATAHITQSVDKRAEGD